MPGIARPVIRTTALAVIAASFIAVLLGLTIAGEIPRGAVTGRVVDERGVPLKHASVDIRRRDVYATVASGVTNAQGVYTISDVPADAKGYDGYAQARGYETEYLNPDKLAVREGKVTTVPDVVLRPRPPSIYGGLRTVFVPGERIKLGLHGYSRTSVAHVRMSVYRYDFARRVRELGGKSEPYGDSLSKWHNIGAPVYSREIDVKTDREGYFSREVRLPIKELGGYLINVQHDTAESLFKTLISDLAIVAKRAPDRTLVYASSFIQKKPLAGVKIAFFSKNGELGITGTTDADGLVVTTELPADSLTILGTFGDSYALNYSYSLSWDQPYKCYVYTDRPVYRPGHTVYFKGILRRSVPGSYTPVTGENVSLEITDDEGNKVSQLKLPTDAFGSFYGKVELGAEASSGSYSITADYAGSKDYGSFRVEEYRKPEYKTTVSFRKPHYVGGQKIDAAIEARYYFGAPVAGARVQYTVYKSYDYFHYYPEGEEDYSFYEELYREGDDEEGYYGGYGEVVLESEGVTDENGVLKIEIPTKKTSSEERCEIEASVTDASGRSVDASGGVLVTPGLFKLCVSADRYVYKPGDTVRARICAVDYDRKPVSGERVRVSIYREGDSKHPKDRLMRRETATLGRDGQAVVSFEATRQGYYRIELRGRDRMRNTIKESQWVWVASDDWSGEDYESETLQITLDKKAYKTGDTARVVINSPVRDCYLLLTVEGRRLFDYRMLHLTSSSTLTKIPIVQDYMPNCYISACLVKGAKLVTASRPLIVTPAANFVTVKLDSSKPRYQPGDTATYRIRTIDSEGRGVRAQVSIGVVDESVYAIREDATPDIRKFYYGPVENYVGTYISFSQEYYGGEDKFQGKVRKYFPDTAYWNPAILTDSDGNGSVTFKMPDNLTTWRATARAVALPTAVGSAIQKAIVTKNLLVRLQTPRFFRQRDSLALTAVVHNYTDREQTVRVWLKSSGIKVETADVQTVKLGPAGAGSVRWRASVPHPGVARITVYAQGRGDQDAMELEVPILPHGIESRVFASGTATDGAAFSLATPGKIIERASVLEMGLSPSIAGAALGFTEALKDYSYDSAEGIMDVLLPNVVMYQAMRDLGRATPQQYERIQEMIRRDLKTVYAWQMSGGGWGWWEYGSEDPWMTAYVVYGLVRAQQAGFAIRRDVLDRGIQAAIRSLPHAGDIGKRSTMIYVLALAGKAKIEWVNEVLKSKKLQNYSLALMILSLDEMGQAERARSLVPKLEKGAVETGLGCSWPEIFPWGFYSCNRFETTAYAVRALLAVDPENPRIAKGVRWLVTNRRGERYEGNYDTASVVYALADYLTVHKPIVPNYTARVYVNNRLVSEFDVRENDLYAPERRIRVAAPGVVAGRNAIRIEKTGPGELFYWASLKHFPSMENIPALKSKIAIRRDYYRLEIVRDPKQGLIYKPRRIEGVIRVGELVRCRLTVTAPKDFRYLVVDDWLPSGCEVVQRHGPGEYYEWNYWWSGEVVHDNRVSFMLSEVYSGKRAIEYDFRCELQGRFHVMPAVAQGHFEPDIFAHSAEKRLTVE